MQLRSFDSLLNTYFTVFGPIATIDFGKTGTRRTVLVSDDLCEITVNSLVVITRSMM